jgi:putative PIG3 family NAD(P)H quinone oxidoreductase
LEVAGTVVEAGAGVDRWQAGDRVCALLAGGGYAEYCVAPAPQCLPVPDGMEFSSAAAIPEAFFTVWTNVFERGRFQAGESALIHGGSSGIGTTAIQLVRAFGGRVFATAGSAEKCAACERLGAERAINYREADFVAAIRDVTGGHGVDVILDMVGGEYLARNLDLLAVDGRLVQIALIGGAKTQINLGPVLQRRLTVTGSTLRARSVAEKGAIADKLHQHVWPLLESRVVAPIVYRTFPLRDAAAAHRLMESGVHIGKLVLTIA